MALNKILYVILGMLIVFLLLFGMQFFKKESSSLVNTMFGGKLGEYAEDKFQADTVKQRTYTYSILINNLHKGQVSSVRFDNINPSSEVCQIAGEITKDKTSSKEKSEEIFDYMIKYIEYDFGNIVYDTFGKPKIKSKKTPIQTFEERKGLCGEQVELFMYMSECVGIRTYKAYGGAHAWTVFPETSESVIEIDTTQECFNCKLDEPIIGVCDSHNCIDLDRI